MHWQDIWKRDRPPRSLDNKYDGYQGDPIDYRHIDHVREVAQNVRHEKRKRKSPLKKITAHEKKIR